MLLSRLYCIILTSLALPFAAVIDGFQAALSHPISTRENARRDRSSCAMMVRLPTSRMRTPRRYYLDDKAPGRHLALHVIDPATAWNAVSGIDTLMATVVGNAPGIGAAVLGVAAGALSQAPIIQQLNDKISELNVELEISQANLTSKIILLEDKLFEMDREFEDQTSRFKKQYDNTQRAQLEQIKEKLKQEYQFKLDIQREQRKSEELMKQVDKEHKRTNQQQEVSNLTLQKQQLEEANSKLEKALLQSEEELKHMRELASEKSRKRFFLF